MPALLRAALLAVATALLASCSTLPKHAPVVEVQGQDVARFELGGRISLRVQDENFPGRVRWQHDAALDELWFYTPIGTTVAHLRQDDSGATLVTSEGREYRAGAIRELASDILGWDLPIEALPYWVRGLPAPDGEEPQVRRDDHGRIDRLVQAGWRVSYLAWDASGVKGLPTKLDVSGPRLRMRLIIDQWQLPRAR